jgi:succinate-acetate transporter protein
MAGLAVAQMMSGTIEAKIWGTQADLLQIAIFGFAFGGLAQLGAAMWAYRARDAAATLTHGAWGAFWTAYFPLQLWKPGHYSFGYGLWLLGIAFVTLTAAAAREPSHPLMAAMRAVLTAAAAVSAVGYLTGGFPSGWVTVGGYLFVAAAALAWAGMSWMLYVSLRRWEPIELAWAEPGVKRGQ